MMPSRGNASNSLGARCAELPSSGDLALSRLAADYTLGMNSGKGKAEDKVRVDSEVERLMSLHNVLRADLTWVMFCR
jgi:hypothetical protein